MESLERRKQIYNKIRGVIHKYFSSEGEYIYSDKPLTGYREFLWWALALFEGDQEYFNLGERIIDKIPKGSLDGFSAVTRLKIIFRYKERLSNTIKEKLIDDLHSDSSYDAGTRDFIFQGYNDNAPSMATFVLLGCGMLFEDKSAIKQGLANLYVLSDLLKRRGCLSEFVSPTYAPITLLGLAEIVNWIEHKEAKELALKTETHIWTELLTHFHEPTSKLAGPHSRAYQNDTVGHLTCANILMYYIFGDRIFINPMNMFFPLDKKQVIIHDLAYMLSLCSWIISPDYHIAKGSDNLLKKTYPYSVFATAEIGTGHYLRKPLTYDFEFGGVPIVLTTYMEEDYAVGSSSRQFHNGAQTNIWHLSYKKKEHVKSIADTNTAFIRYVINDKQPGEDNNYPEFGLYKGNNLFVEEGRALAIQDKQRSLILYRPRFASYEKIFSLKTSIIFSEHYRNVENLWLYDKEVQSLPIESQELVDVFVKDGEVIVGIRPLSLTNHGRNSAIRIERVNQYLMISFYNYLGEPRAFTSNELVNTLNGALIEVESINNITLNKFRKRFATHKVFDTYFANNRTVLCQCNSSELGLIYSPISEHIKSAIINGKLRSEATHIEAKGIKPEFLPFLKDKRNINLDNYFTLYTRPLPK